MNIVVAGHVDHGKSTVIGRLLADTHTLPDGKIEGIRELCRRTGKPFEYAFLLDALKDERAQGITIDTARCFFESEKRKYIIIDAPGHIEFLKNMITGASRADAALLVIDAAEGICENSRRHGYMLEMLGIRQIAVLVNKIDLVNYDRAVYDSICRDFTEFLASIGIEAARYIPVSAMEGDNIASHSDRTPWYDGPDVLEQLDLFEGGRHEDSLPLRIPVEDVYKFTEGGDDRRIVAGLCESGSLRAGDRVVFYPSGKTTVVRTLEEWFMDADSSRKPEVFCAGKSCGFTMTTQIYVHRGEIACREGEEAPKVGRTFRASMFWLGKSPLVPGKEYLVKSGTAKTVRHRGRLRDLGRRHHHRSSDGRRRRHRFDRRRLSRGTGTLSPPEAAHGLRPHGGIRADPRAEAVRGGEAALLRRPSLGRTEGRAPLGRPCDPDARRGRNRNHRGCGEGRHGHSSGVGQRAGSVIRPSAIISKGERS